MAMKRQHSIMRFREVKVMSVCRRHKHRVHTKKFGVGSCVCFRDWDFGLFTGIFHWKGTVLSRIWPTVVFFMLYSTAVLFIPNQFVMSSSDNTAITVLGIILGSLLGIRTNAAYERYRVHTQLIP